MFVVKPKGAYMLLCQHGAVFCHTKKACHHTERESSTVMPKGTSKLSCKKGPINLNGRWSLWIKDMCRCMVWAAMCHMLSRIPKVIDNDIKRKPYGWQVCEERLLELWPQPYHPRPQVKGDAARVTTRVVCPHAPVNHMVFFLCHGFIKFMYINKIFMKTRL